MFNKTGKNLFIITGISGAGKTKALQFFGDFGFYCVDNLPLSLFEAFIKLLKQKHLNNTALGVDIREGSELDRLPRLIEKLKKDGFSVKLIFLNAQDEKLVSRFSETKHKHPLNKELLAAIAHERAQLKELRNIADFEIDTTNTTLGELKDNISALIGVKKETDMTLNIVSFGFKYGIPLQSDLMFDVRFLPNPYYQDKLKKQTGLDKDVRLFLDKAPDSKEFLAKLYDMVKYLLPKYIKEGKSYLTVSIGCTGGKHRSVYMAHNLAAMLKADKIKASQYHRDIEK